MKKIFIALIIIGTVISCGNGRARINDEFFDGHIELGTPFSEEDQEFMEELSVEHSTSSEEGFTVRTYAVTTTNHSQQFDFVKVYTKNRVACAVEFQYYDEEKSLKEEYNRAVRNAIGNYGEPESRHDEDGYSIRTWKWRNLKENMVRTRAPSRRQMELARLFNEEPEETSYIILTVVQSGLAD